MQVKYLFFVSNILYGFFMQSFASIFSSNISYSESLHGLKTALFDKCLNLQFLSLSKEFVNTTHSYFPDVLLDVLQVNRSLLRKYDENENVIIYKILSNKSSS